MSSYDPGSKNNEVRKIQFTGRSTYILSLPKKWLTEMHLKAGDPVVIIREANNSLSILPEPRRGRTSASGGSSDEVTAIVLQNEDSASLKRKVVSIYLAGYSVIHLKSKVGRINPVQRDAIREVIRRNLVGTEIIADASDIITIQILISIPELSVNTAVRRMFLIAASMHRDALSSLAELNYEIAQGVIKSDDEVDRFSLYILRNLVIASQNERILREIGLKKPSDCLSYRVTVKSIERIADHAYGIADSCLKIKEKIPTEIFRKIEKMSEISLTALNDAVEAFLRRDYTLADRTVDRAKSLRSLENDIILLLDKEEEKKTIRNPLSNINIRLILEDIRRTAEHSSDIAEAAMNQTIDEIIEKTSTPSALPALEEVSSNIPTM
ncbi:MAG: phosphate uptake regulator PhoU [Nitrososphaeraceae archaeon]